MIDLTAFSPPDWIPLDIARTRLSDALNGFLDDAFPPSTDQEKPALALRVSAGVGKTHAALRVIAARGRALLKTGHVLVFVPTHDLAEQAHADFLALDSGLASLVLRGRGAEDPSSGVPMCEKAKIAERLGEILRSVKEALCEEKQARVKAGEIATEPRMAACRTGCRYFAQMPTRSSVIFLAHAYLTLPDAVKGPIALRVIDEKCVQALTRTGGVSIGDWMSLDRADALDQARATRLQQHRGLLLTAMQTGAPVIAALRAAGLTAQELRDNAEAEAKAAPQLNLVPTMTPQAQTKLLDAFDLPALKLARARAAIWSAVKDAWERDGTERLSFATAADGPSICSHRARKIPRDAPLVLLDADADPVITEAIAPGAAFVRIDVKPNVDVVQIRDRTLANSSLVGDNGAATCAVILDIIEREARRGARPPLLVAPKEVLRTLHLRSGAPGAFEDDAALLAPLRGAEPRWLGAGLQGMNDYRDAETVIVVGRVQPPLGVIEDAMRCLFGDSAEPLVFAHGVGGRAVNFIPSESVYLSAHDTALPAKAQTHPDPRGVALLTIMREAHSTQAIARLRAVGATAPKRVVVLSSLPLPDLPVATLTTLNALALDVPEEEAGWRFRKLEDAMFDAEGEHPVPGLRLSRAGIAEDARHVFPGKTGAEAWARGLDPAVIQAWSLRIARKHGWEAQIVSLRRASGGKATPAVVLGRADKVAAIVAQAWPGMEVAAF